MSGPATRWCISSAPPRLHRLNRPPPPNEPAVSRSAAKLRQPADKLTGREPALQQLDDAWTDDRTNVVVIRAWGGVGKTSLAAEWMAELALKGWRGARRVFDWTF